MKSEKVHKETGPAGQIHFYLRKRVSVKKMSVKRPVAAIDTDDQAIPEDMLQIAVATNRAIQIRQDNRSAADGEIQIKGIFRSFLRFEKGGGVQESRTAPERGWINKKSDGKPFPKPFDLQVQVMHMTPCKDQCEVLPNGTGFRVKVSLGYADDAKQWLLDHYKAWYSGQYKGTKFPIGEYVSPEGVIADEKWQTFEHKAKITINSSDTDSSPFRRKNKNQTGPEVTSRTCMSFLKCSASQWVKLKKQEVTVTAPDAGAAASIVDGEPQPQDGPAVIAPAGQKITTFYPQAFTTFTSKGVELSEDHDATMAETERIHLIENKDAHQMVPIEALRNGTRHAPNTAYFYACDRYQTHIPAKDGVTIFKIRVDETKDFYSVYDGNEQCRHTVRLNMFQWHGDPGQPGKEQYSVKIVCAKQAAEQWRNFGIGNKQSYGAIIHATQDIPLHVDCELGREATLTQAINKPENLNDKSEFGYMRGHYTYWASSIIPDYPRYLPTRALRISRDRLETEFDLWIGTTGKGINTKKTMVLSVPPGDNKPNPLHVNLLNSPIIALGNGQVVDPKSKMIVPINHGYNGDVWPILDDCDFYVLTSHRLTTDEIAKYCGRSADLAACDAFLDYLIGEQKVHYWIFAVNRAMLPVLPSEQKKSKPAAADEPVATVAAAAAADDELEQSSAMDVEEDGPPRSTKKKSSGRKKR